MDSDNHYTAPATALPIATVAARLLSSYLFEASPADPIALVTAGMLMLLIAAIAVSLPALRATRVDPLSALRHD